MRVENIAEVGGVMGEEGYSDLSHLGFRLISKEKQQQSKTWRLSRSARRKDASQRPSLVYSSFNTIAEVRNRWTKRKKASLLIDMLENQAKSEDSLYEDLNSGDGEEEEEEEADTKVGWRMNLRSRFEAVEKLPSRTSNLFSRVHQNKGPDSNSRWVNSKSRDSLQKGAESFESSTVYKTANSVPSPNNKSPNSKSPKETLSNTTLPLSQTTGGEGSLIRIVSNQRNFANSASGVTDFVHFGEQKNNIGFLRFSIFKCFVGND